ncbi:MAG: ATP-binding cassette domain-containing protein, partial [Galactobacter sp.]
MHTPTLSLRSHAQLTLSGVDVSRAGNQILHAVDLSISPASRVAIVGENGRGKSTLLQVLAGALEPSSGAVHRHGSLALVDQELPASADTVAHVVDQAIAAERSALARFEAATAALAQGEITAGAGNAPSGIANEDEYAAALEEATALDAWDADRRIQVALEALGAITDRSRRLASMSVGQRHRVRLACLLGASHDFLLLDEPTNHLDADGLTFLTTQLRSRRGAVVLVSHDRALLQDVADTFVDLDPTPDGRPRVHGGGYAEYRSARASELARWEQEYQTQQAEHARLQQDLTAAQNRLVSGWRPEKGSPKHGRATRADSTVRSVHRRQAALDTHAVTMPQPPQAFRFPDLPARAGKVLQLADVSLPGRLLGPVSFSLGSGDRLVVTGPNGAGKSTLLGIASGVLAPETGQVHVPSGVRLGFLRQESSLPGGVRAAQVYSSHVESLVSRGLLDAGDAVGLSHLGLLRSREAGLAVES